MNYSVVAPTIPLLTFGDLKPGQVFKWDNFTYLKVKVVTWSEKPPEIQTGNALLLPSQKPCNEFAVIQFFNYTHVQLLGDFKYT